jgi:hypothetical protein
VDEEKTETIEKIKQHVVRNKKVYIAGGVCFVLGAATAIVLKDKGSLVSVKEFLNMKWHSPTTNQFIMPALGHPGNVVQCIETGTVYASEGEAARTAGVSVSYMSRHLHDMVDHINGNHFKVIGKAGQPLAS